MSDEVAMKLFDQAVSIASQPDFQKAQNDDYIAASTNLVREKLHDLIGAYDGDVGSVSFAYFVTTQVIIAVSLGIALAEREISPQIPEEEIPEEEIPEDIRQRAASLSVSCGMIASMMLKDGVLRKMTRN